MGALSVDVCVKVQDSTHACHHTCSSLKLSALPVGEKE